MLTFEKAEVLARVNERVQHRALLEQTLRETPAYPENRFAGRGIVLCGGGDVYFACAWVCAGMLRQMGCTLPIELWYRGPREMSAEMIALMQQHQVRCIDAFQMARRYPARRLDAWELKPYAIVHSSFEEVLSLDADNVPVTDPSFLFTSAPYLEHGSLFWPDFYLGPHFGQQFLKPAAWEICGVPYRQEREFETGQLIVNKRRCWHALIMTCHLNDYSDYYYQFFHGDKDTFHIAWLRTETAYAMPPHFPRHLSGVFQVEVMVQLDFEGKALFQHRNGHKWSVLRPNQRVPGFLLEDDCFRLLEDLKVRWRPKANRFPEEFTPAEWQLYQAVCRQKFFDYRIGRDTYKVELAGDFTVNGDQSPDALRWMIEADQHGTPLILLRYPRIPPCFLRPGPERTWRGRIPSLEAYTVELSSRPLFI